MKTETKNKTAAKAKTSAKSPTKSILWGAAAVAAVGAGAYFFYGTEKGKKYREEAIEWMKKAEGEVMDAVRAIGEEGFNKENYERIVDGVAEKYRMIKNVDRTELAEFVLNLKRAWNQLEAAGKSSPATARPKKLASGSHPAHSHPHSHPHSQSAHKKE